MRWMGLIALLFVLVLPLRPVPATAGPQVDAVIVSWTDGDTVRVKVRGALTRVRLIGIDAPEMRRGNHANGQARQLGVNEREIILLATQSRSAANYVERFVAGQQAARQAEVGIWASRPEPATLPAPTPVANCHSSYPTICIPPPPPDLDCADIPYRRFQVVGDDPHRFDGDGDGIGCE